MGSKYVYVIAATNGMLKIGRTAAVFDRFTMVQCNSPLPVRISYMCRCVGADGIEKAAHKALAQYRKHREWFEVDVGLAISTLRSIMTELGAVPRPMLERPTTRHGSNLGGRKPVHFADVAETTLG